MDRKFFVPRVCQSNTLYLRELMQRQKVRFSSPLLPIFTKRQGHEDSAHSDQPLKEGNVHISAPHIYGSVIEALALVPNSCTSFLNIGSGTGYVSCIVAEILGPNSLNYGIFTFA